MAVGDLNGDVHPDAAVAFVNDFGPITAVFLGDGTGNLAWDNEYWGGGGWVVPGVAIGDFNEDGFADLLTSTGYNAVALFAGNGTGSFVDRSDIPTAFVADDLAAADLNGDGHLDFAAASSGDRRVEVGLGTGTGSFQTAREYPTGLNAEAVTVADLNQDGHADLLLTGVQISSDTLSVLLGSGDGSFGAPQLFFTAGLGPAAVGRFNADSFPDVAVPDYDHGTVSVLLNAADWVASPTLSISDVTVTEGNTGITNAVFTVTLSTAATSPVSVHYATRDGDARAGTDYAATSGTLTFAPGETTRTITVEVFGDRGREADETFYVSLFNLSTNALFVDDTGLGTIRNDD